MPSDEFFNFDPSTPPNLGTAFLGECVAGVCMCV